MKERNSRLDKRLVFLGPQILIAQLIAGESLTVRAGVGASFTPVPMGTRVPLGTGYRENLRNWVPLGTGYRANFRNWVPMGTGYQPEKKFGYRVPEKFSLMPTPG